MRIFSYHLANTSYLAGIKAVLLPIRAENVQGMIHAECMTAMTLGSAVFSPSRILPGQVVMFAQWEGEDAIDDFLENNRFGRSLAKGWHTRLVFMRQWGEISGFEIPDEEFEFGSPDEPVVAVTIARMKLPQVPRFISWGRPVEKLVRDHPGKTLALASIRFPRTVSTFSIWQTQKEMTDMVRGHSDIPQPKRHIDAMKERDRKDFHFEFTTLRFKPLSEHGEWRGRSNWIPDLNR